MTPDFLGWVDDSEAGKQWLFDRDSNVIVDLGEAPGESTVFLNGNHVIWRLPSGDFKTGTLTR
jgi:hypothetical protein